MEGKLLQKRVNPKPHSIVSSQLTDNQSVTKITKSFWFLRYKLNPDYESGLIIKPLRSCLLHNNVNRKNWIIKTKPKWETILKESHLDKETGEITYEGEYVTNDLKSGNYRKIKAVNRFCDVFQPLYSRNKISMFFYTLTMANQSETTIRELMNSLKTRLKRKNMNVLGHTWVLEVSDKNHIHYHLLLATDRVNLKGKKMPNYLKANSIWKCRTKVEFAKSDLRYYLAKYFSKNSSRVLGNRSYGLSMKFTDSLLLKLDSINYKIENNRCVKKLAEGHLEPLTNLILSLN